MLLKSTSAHASPLLLRVPYAASPLPSATHSPFRPCIAQHALLRPERPSTQRAYSQTISAVMKLFSVLFTFAFFTVALVHAEDGPKHSLNRMHARRTADAGARDDGGAGGGEDGGGKLSCKRVRI